MDKQSTDMLRKTMTKKAFREYMRSQRVITGTNTGTRTMKDKRDYAGKRPNISKLIEAY